MANDDNSDESFAFPIRYSSYPAKADATENESDGDFGQIISPADTIETLQLVQTLAVLIDDLQAKQALHDVKIQGLEKCIKLQGQRLAWQGEQLSKMAGFQGLISDTN